MSENTQIRRYVNGSIDYTFYDRRARTQRGVTFRAAGASIKAHIRYLLGRLSGSRTARHPITGQPQAQPILRQKPSRIVTVTSPRYSISKAA